MINKLTSFLRKTDLLLVIIAITSVILLCEHAGIISFQSKNSAIAIDNAPDNRNHAENERPDQYNDGHEKGAPEPPHDDPEQESAIPAEPPRPITIEDIENINYDNINDDVHPAQSYLIVADFLSSFNIDVSKIYNYDGEAQRMNKLHKYDEEKIFLNKACQEAKSLLDKHMDSAYREYSEKFPQAAAQAEQFKNQAKQVSINEPHKALYFYVNGLKQFENYNKK